MRRSVLKLCFAIFFVWLLTAWIVTAADFKPSADPGLDDPLTEELQATKAVSPPVLPLTPKAVPQTSSASAPAPDVALQASLIALFAPDAATQAADVSVTAPDVVAQATDVSVTAPAVVAQAADVSVSTPDVAPQASGVSVPAPDAAPQASGGSVSEPDAAHQVSDVPVLISDAVPQASEVAAHTQPSEEESGFFVKFNNANLYEVIHTLAANAGINYLIDPRVKGVVNVHTQGMLRKSSSLDLLFTILRVNGATAVKEGNTYHILPMSDARMEPLIPSIAGDKTEKGAPGQVSMRVYPLQFISAGEMAVVIKPLLSPAGEVLEIGRANMLLVIDTEANLDKAARLVELLDSDVFRSARMKLFRLKTLDPEEMAKNLENIFGALNFSAAGGGGVTKPSGINLVPISRLNALLVVSASSSAMTDVERWIEELDRPGGSSSRSVHRYRIRYGKVADISIILSQLYPSTSALGRAGDKQTEFRSTVSQSLGQSANSPTQPAVTSQGPAQPSRPAAASSKSGKRGEEDKKPFDIIPDEATNSLIIRASMAEYTDLLGILKAIDVYPQQVLLEVLVGEVNLSDDMKLGISWQWSGTSGTNQNVSHGVNLMESAFLNNFSYLVEKTNRISALFKSLAEDGRASILSSPSIIAANGKKSTINVVDQIPITTSVLNSATNPPVTTTSVEYRDVGVILTFTPFINDDGLVTMEIEQEVSDVNIGTASASGSNPSFFKRSITTNLVASQDQSIVLGGLVKEKKSLGRSGLPFLYKIPVVGWLFGSREDSVSRNELLIFITPRVIRSVEEGVKLSRDFEDRVAQLKARMGEAKGMR